jgi:hypothetical protein
VKAGSASPILSPRAPRVLSAAFRRSVFLKLIRCRVKNRRTDRSVVTNPTPARIRRSSCRNVRSGSCATSFNRQSLCGSSGERLLPPRGRGLTFPVASCRSTQRPPTTRSPDKAAPLAAATCRPPPRPQPGCEDGSKTFAVPSVPSESDGPIDSHLIQQGNPCLSCGAERSALHASAAD